MKLSIEALQARISSRTYDGSALTPDQVAALESAFREASPGPFGRTSRFALVAGVGEGKGRKIGTYGVITNAPAYIAGVVEKGEFACVDFGYSLEGIVLRAAELGLGTCWLGGIFDRGAVLKALDAGRSEFCPATTPIGRASGQLSFQDRLIRQQAGSRNRKAHAELFFAASGAAGTAGEWAPLEDQGSWTLALDAVRIGPSASNKQPWRLVLDRRGGAEVLHLFMQEDRLYNNMLGAVKLQELDMGIAMRHVEVAEASEGRQGSWMRLPASPMAASGTRKYIATWSRA